MPQTVESRKAYAKGYATGIKRVKFLEEELKRVQNIVLEREEARYFKCLELVLNNCEGWSVGNKKINNAKGYCNLAKIFADESISAMNK